MKDAPAPADRYPGPRTAPQQTPRHEAAPDQTTTDHDNIHQGTARRDAGLLRRRAHAGTRIPQRVPAQTAGGRKGTRARDSGSPVRRPAQIGGRVVYQRDGHCAGRNTRPTAASGAPGPQPAGAYPALPLPLREPHHSGTAGGGACHGAVELSLPARPRPAGGGARRRELRGAETLHNLGPYLPPHREHPRRDISPGLRVGF